MHYYDVSVAWTGGRRGQLESPVLECSLEVATPPEFPGGEAGIWSPEHLLVAAVNSCLMTTFLAIADKSRLPFTSFRADARGKLDLLDGKYAITEINLRPLVSIPEENLREKAATVLKKAEAHCLISNSVRAKIIFEPEIRVSQPA